MPWASTPLSPLASESRPEQSQSPIPLAPETRAERSRSPIAFTAILLTLALSSCAGNQAAENALKPDPRLTTPQTSPQPEAKPETPIARSPEPTPKPEPTPTDWKDRDKLPSQLKPYVEDVLALNLLLPDDKNTDRKTIDQLNAPITRREFAKWLLLINNHYYKSRLTRQIRIVSGNETAVSAETSGNRSSNTLAFSDIPSTDPDFIVLQSLAEAGILPSQLSGDDKTEKFRPTDPLKREDLLRWKVPLDIRSPQTPGSIETLQKTIPFQDSSKINHPDSLRAIALDLQNNDQSNVRRSFGYTKLLQPQRNVTRAEAAAALWSIGTLPEVVTAKEVTTGKTPEPSPSPTPNQNPSPKSSPIGG